jgi:hypothetical protein
MAIPPALRGKAFLARDAVEAGLLTADHLRTRAWKRVFQGIYADSRLTVTHAVRCAAALAFVLPDGAVLAGRSAAMMLGVGLGDAADPVEALIPLGALPCRHRGILIHRGPLADQDRLLVQGLPVTSPVRTCWDLARWLEPVEAVVWIDRVIALGPVTKADLVAFGTRRHQLPRVRGWRRFDAAVSLVDGRSESAPESRLRVRLTLAGLPPPEVQVTILDDNGRFVARVDLAWPELRIAVEYDGLWHVGSRSQMHADRRRLNALAGLGWIVLHVTSARLRDDFDAVVAEIRTAMQRRRFAAA